MHGLPLLLLIAFGGLTGLGVTGLLVSNGQARAEKLRQRLAGATAPHQRTRKQAPRRLVRNPEAQGRNSPRERIAAIFGFNTARQDQYPVKWWVLLSMTLIVSRLIAGVVVALVGSFGWFALPVIWVYASRTVFNTMLARRRQALYSQFPDCLSMIVRSVRAGVPITEAIRVVARECPEPSSGEFARVAGDLAIGTPIADALKALADRNDITEFRFFATALALQSQTGGRLGETLDNLGGIIRKRMALKARGRALASEARLTAMILGGLPVLTTGMLYLLNPGYVDILFFDPTGQIILLAALASLGTGAFVMRTIIVKSLA